MITRKFPAVIARSQTEAAQIMNVPIQVELAWDPDHDPFAVQMICSLDDGEVVWVFGRDLLADGLRSLHPTGMGDVKMRLASEVRVHLIVCIKSPDGHADILLPVLDTETFLGETRQHTELGDEATDGLIDEFLKEFE